MRSEAHADLGRAPLLVRGMVVVCWCVCFDSCDLQVPAIDRSTTDVRFVEADSAGWDTSSLKFDALQSYADLRVDRRQYCDAISEVLLCIFAQVSVNVMPFGK